MKSKRKNSIFIKTLTYLVIFCVSILLIFWLSEIFFFSLYYKWYQINNVNKVALQIKQNHSNEEIENIAYTNNVCIAIYTSNNSVYKFNNKMPGCNLENIKLKQYINSFNFSKDTNKSYIIRSTTKNGYLNAFKINNNSIFVYAPIEEINNVNVIMKNQIIYLVVLAIGLACLIASLISKKITSPINKITLRASKIGSEEYDTSFEETSIKEIDDLNLTLNKVQDDLGKIKEYQQDLLANVSHDLKTPLTMIRAYAEKIRDISYKDYDKLVSDTSVIIDETNRLTLLVNDILELTKLQNNSDKICIEEYDLIAEVRNILNKYEIIKETENYIIETDMPETLRIKADKQKINQVIYNLINNAINYTGDDNKVKISISKKRSGYIVKIIDTGKGISKEDLNHIWNKYYKNDKNHKRSVVSTGLGLSIVREILKDHNFEYGVKSTVNKGSTFYFIIDNKSIVKSLPKIKENKTSQN